MEVFSAVYLQVYISAAWVNLLPDVLSDSSPVWNMGITDNGPLARTGDPEDLIFYLNNSQRNSAGLIGYYSPGHANVLAGWGTGLPVRLYFEYESKTFYKYYGNIRPDGINVSPGIYGPRSVRVACHGFMSQAAEHDLNLLTLRENESIGTIIPYIVANMPIAPLATSLATDGDVYPTVFDTVQRRTKATGEFQKLAVSEQGYIYTRGDRTGGQTLVAESRDTRSGSTVTQIPLAGSEAGFSLNEDGGFLLNEDGGFSLLDEVQDMDFSDMALPGMKISYGKDLANRVIGRTYPRKVDAAATTVLFATQERFKVEAGQTKTGLRGSYRDPSGVYPHANGKDFVDPPLSGTDFTATANQDGTGASLTANISVAIEPGTEAVEYSVTNSGGSDAWVYYQIRGKGIYWDDAVEVVFEDATSQTTNGGVYTLTLDMKYQNRADLGESFVQYALSQEKDPHTTCEGYPMNTWRNSIAMYGFLYGEPGTRGIFTESMSAISGEYFIQGYSARLIRLSEGYGVEWSPVLVKASGAFGVWDVDKWDEASWAFPE